MWVKIAGYKLYPPEKGETIYCSVRTIEGKSINLVGQNHIILQMFFHERSHFGIFFFLLLKGLSADSPNV